MLMKIRLIPFSLACVYSLLFVGTAFAQSQDQTSYGTSLHGTLETGDRAMRSDGSLYDAYTFEGYANQEVTINLYSSEFDTYLILRAPGGEVIGENDDKNQDNQSSELTLTLRTTGTYTVVANGYSQDSRGKYYISLGSSNVSTELQISGSRRTSEACTTAISEATRRFNEVAQVRVIGASKNDLPAYNYSSYPFNRPNGYSFLLTGAGVRTVSASPRFVESIVTDIMTNCDTVSIVSLGVYQTGGGGWTFGFSETGKPELFNCVEPDRSRPDDYKFGWGYEICV
jgi:hypothetical protein